MRKLCASEHSTGTRIKVNRVANPSPKITATAIGPQNAELEPPIDTVVLQVTDDERFRASALRGRKFGFAGKLCIHPSQVTICNEVFTPTSAEVDHARAVVAAFEAAEAAGVSRWVMIRRHVVPNVLGPVVVYMTLTIPGVILIESFLSFLGLGVQEPLTSWGRLIAEGAQEMETAPWMLLFPVLFMAITLFCFNFIGDGLRDALDPKDR